MLLSGRKELGRLYVQRTNGKLHLRKRTFSSLAEQDGYVATFAAHRQLLDECVS